MKRVAGGSKKIQGPVQEGGQAPVGRGPVPADEGYFRWQAGQ
jgi:hypothetical protein